MTKQTKGMITTAQSKAYRKYQITINNPLEHGFSHEQIKQILSTFRNITYWCMCDEIGGLGTYHTHLYLFSPNAILYSTIHQRFYGCHIEAAKGTHRENRDYILKDGKWLADSKHETNLIDTFEENGELPLQRDKRESVSEDILGLIEDGASNAEIIRQHPGAMNRLQHIEKARQTLLEERYCNEWRTLDVTYVWGKPGTGKTRYFMEKYGYSDVYRVTNYDHPYDNYQGQDVLIFDEYRSGRPITELLELLDGYPVTLPCRYADKVACYTKVVIISNIPLEQQYPNVQCEEPVTFDALKRRIHRVIEFLPGDDPDMPF